jgi:hypothetical protein
MICDADHLRGSSGMDAGRTGVNGPGRRLVHTRHHAAAPLIFFPVFYPGRFGDAALTRPQTIDGAGTAHRGGERLGHSVIRAEPVDLRALSLTRPRGLDGLESVFVGRGSELADLQRAYGHVAVGGRPLLVTVVGDAGVGKTRLVREFWRWLGEDARRPLLRSGRCLSYGHGITYWPLGDVLKEHFGILDSDPPEVVAERVAGREGLGYTLGLAPPPGMHPLTVRDRLQTSWVGFLQELTSERPAAVLVEDLH